MSIDEYACNKSLPAWELNQEIVPYKDTELSDYKTI
jgi:hypothetical protein